MAETTVNYIHYVRNTKKSRVMALIVQAKISNKLAIKVSISMHREQVEQQHFLNTLCVFGILQNGRPVLAHLSTRQFDEDTATLGQNIVVAEDHTIAIDNTLSHELDIETIRDYRRRLEDGLLGKGVF